MMNVTMSHRNGLVMMMAMVMMMVMMVVEMVRMMSGLMLDAKRGSGS